MQGCACDLSETIEEAEQRIRQNDITAVITDCQADVKFGQVNCAQIRAGNVGDVPFLVVIAPECENHHL